MLTATLLTTAATTMATIVASTMATTAVITVSTIVSTTTIMVTTTSMILTPGNRTIMNKASFFESLQINFTLTDNIEEISTISVLNLNERGIEFSLNCA